MVCGALSTHGSVELAKQPLLPQDLASEGLQRSTICNLSLPTPRWLHLLCIFSTHLWFLQAVTLNQR